MRRLAAVLAVGTLAGIGVGGVALALIVNQVVGPLVTTVTSTSVAGVPLDYIVNTAVLVFIFAKLGSMITKIHKGVRS